MRRILKSNSFIFILYAIFIVAGGLLLIFTNKGDIFLFINKNNTLLFDKFFFHITKLGNGFIFLIIFIIFLFIKYRYSLMLLFSALLSTIFVHSFKQIICPLSYRPARYFNDLSNLHLLDQVNVRSFGSFPSGHTATAFTVFFLLIFIIKKKILKSVFLLIALSVAFSRIYLAQHFFIDVYFGSVFGTLSAFISYWFFTEYYDSKKIKWIDNSII